MASRPVAAWTSRAGMLVGRLSMMRMAMAQVDERRERARWMLRRPPGAERATRPDHVGGDRREHEDALESFPKHQHGDIEDTRPEIAVTGRVRQPASPEHLQEENGRDGECADRQADGRKWYPFQHLGDIRPFKSNNQAYSRQTWSSIGVGALSHRP